MDSFHGLSHQDAAAVLMSCCAVRSWASAVAGLRPFPDASALAATGRKLAEALTWQEVLEALAAHPRIGEAHSSQTEQTRLSRWSQQEQAGVSARSKEQIRQGNAAYERRFGHLFLICATGLSGEQLLAQLAARLENDAARERDVVREELAKIVELRLRKLVQP